MNKELLMETKGSILVVDDTLDNLRLLNDLLTREGYIVRPVPDGRMALTSAQVEPPDLILLDIMMPGMDGYEVCQRLKADERTAETPVIFLSALGDVMDKIKAFGAGGVDYILKPFQLEEVMIRVKTHLTIRRLQKTLEEKNAQLELEIAERKFAQEELERLASTDPLTGLYNRRRFFMLAEAEFRKATRYNRPLSVILFDVDLFKRVNDTYGHGIGDQALIHVARMARVSARDADVISRHGGEEFALLLPETNRQDARIAGERLRNLIEKTPVTVDGHEILLTVSVGVADNTSFHPDRFDQILIWADRALYDAKETGRNKVIVYEKFA
jgi:diguanylate cyclase (GGDEF)-like protein